LNNPDDDGFLSVYTLSLPGFRWFKSNESTPVRRSNHYCQIIGSVASNGNSQMLSIGGRQPSSYVSLGVAPDPWTNGLAVFDMNAFSWTDHYNAGSGPYVQPSVIKEYYSNNYQEPTFSDPALAKAFAYTPPAKPSTTSSSSKPASPTSTGPSPASSSPSSSSSTSHTGAIVGGAVGGVAFVILVLVAFFVIRQRRRKAAAAAASQAANQAANQAEQQHSKDQKPVTYEAPTYQDGNAPVEKDVSRRSELPNNPTAELAGNQNVMAFKRKPVGGSPAIELPGS